MDIDSVAAQAMAGMLAAWDAVTPIDMRQMCKNAYMIADEMLEASREYHAEQAEKYRTRPPATSIPGPGRGCRKA